MKKTWKRQIEEESSWVGWHAQYKCTVFSPSISHHSTDFSPVKWAGDMKTALCLSPPSCGDTPTEGFPGGGSASPWISPLTLSCWCRDGRQWTPPRSRRWSPRAGDKWRGGTVGGQQKWVVWIEYGWVCVCVYLPYLPYCHFVDNKAVYNEWIAHRTSSTFQTAVRVSLKPSMMLEGISGSRRFFTASPDCWVVTFLLSC